MKKQEYFLMMKQTFFKITKKMIDGINNKTFEPRKYFIENYGIINAGKKLKKIYLRSIW